MVVDYHNLVFCKLAKKSFLVIQKLYLDKTGVFIKYFKQITIT